MMSLLTVLSMLLLVGCGGPAQPTSPGAEPAGATDAADEEAAPSDNTTITIAHELGETEVPLKPRRVVVFDLGALETLDKLGIEIVGLPKASLPQHLSKYEDDKYENLGSLVEPDFEKVNALQPDLIIISGRQRDLYEEFDRIAPTIYVGLDFTRYLDSLKENTRTLGKIFGLADEVEARLAEIDAQIEALAEKVTAAGGNALVILANEGNISAFGPNSRFGIIHDTFGFPAADPNIEVSTHGQSVSFEYLVETDPDYLFVIDRGAAIGGQPSAGAILDNELAANMKAVKNGNVVHLDAEVWYLSGGGLISVPMMIEEVSAALP